MDVSSANAYIDKPFHSPPFNFLLLSLVSTLHTLVVASVGQALASFALFAVIKNNLCTYLNKL